MPLCPSWLKALHENSGPHVLDHAAGEFAGLHFGCSRHEALEVVRNFLLLDGALHALLDQIGGGLPAEVAEHHHTRQNNRSRIDHVSIRILRCRAVRGFENRVAIANIRSRRNTQPAHLGGARVGNIVSIQVRRSQYRIFVGSRHHLLEDRVRDAIVDHDFLLPRAIAMRGIDRIQHVFHFFLYRLTERRRSELHPGFDHLGILRNAEVGIFIFIIDDPALAFGHNLVAEFFGRDLVSPLAEGAFSEFLNVALVYQGDGLAAGLERVLNRHADETLGSSHRNRLNADTRVEADLLLPPLQHIFVKELDEALAVGGSLLPLNTGIYVFGVLAEDNHIHALRMLHWRRNALVILHGPYASIEVKNLPQGNVERTNPATDGRRKRPLDCNAKFADSLDGVVRQPGVKLCFCLFPGEHFVPSDAALALVGLLDCRVEYT